jgi:hypothetical protein
MVSRLVILGMLVLALAGRDAGGQVLPKEYAQGMPKEYQELMVAMTAAQARAVRPGDEAMACPAIEKEILATMNDPAIQAYSAKVVAAAEKDAVAAGLPAPGRATSPQAAAALLGVLGAGGMPGMMPAVPLGAAQQAQAAQQQAQALQFLQDPTAQLKLLMPILPQMMRAQRLIGLAMVRTCPWVFGAAPGTAVPPFPGIPR